MTRGEEILAAFDKAESVLEDLRLDHFDDGSIREVIENLGSRVERFFKTAVFPAASSSATFNSLIEELAAMNVSSEITEPLHAFRRAYNASKHEPNQQFTLKQTERIIAEAKVSVQSLGSAGFGSINAQVSTILSRYLWVSVYDVYTQGVSEIYVSLPLPKDDFATHLDVVWIQALDWDKLKADLLSTGCFHYGPEHFDPDVFNKFVEGDFLNAGVWEGDYGQLIKILASYDSRNVADRLIPDLRRDHMFVSVLSAVALAGVDVAKSASTPLSATGIEAEIIRVADTIYAMPTKYPWVRETAVFLAQMIEQLPFASWKELSGPFWNLWNPKPIKAQISSAGESARFVIDDANRIVII